MSRFLLVCVALLLLGCRPATPTSTAPVSPYEVSWRAMVRDKETAHAYTGFRVRFRVEKGDCAVEGLTLRVWYGEKRYPAVLVIQSAATIVGHGPFIVTGDYGPPVVDGIKRGLRVDFSVAITGATVVAAP